MSKLPLKTIALGSDQASKIIALRSSVTRIAGVDPSWANVNVIARRVTSGTSTTPLTDWQIIQGARERALAVRNALKDQGQIAHIYVGLEGGLHSVSIEGEWHTFLRGWAYATDGQREGFGAAPSISLPPEIVKLVIEGRQELGRVIGEISGRSDVRSRQGAWGVLSRNLVTRSLGFELALIAAFAPFYNPDFYSQT